MLSASSSIFIFPLGFVLANHKHNFAIFDTETIGISPKLVYDLGVIICDRFGNEIARHNWAIREVITNPDLMLGAYYSKKTFTHYLPALAAGKIPLVGFAQAQQEFNYMVGAHSVRTVCAYNIAFDRNALKETLLHCKIDGKFLQHKVAALDLWLSSCLTLIPAFVESHTAIEDCEIELAIFAKIAKQKKKLAKNIFHAMPWQIVQRKK
jgi:hypothetical protein